MTPLEKIEDAKKLLLEARGDLISMLENEKSRRRGAILRELHRLADMLGQGGGYFSQAGQDRFVDQLLGQKSGGIFVDIGGYDGVTGSNTLFFEMFRGWSGVMVEPSPTQLAQAKKVRRCACLGCAVAGQRGTAEFMEITQGYTQMSGFLDSYDRDLLARVRSDARHQETIHSLEKMPLADILEEQQLGKVDFLSLDVEGGELDILRSFAFGDFEIDVWSIENNTQSSEIPEIMRTNGYDLIEFAGVDDIFRKKR
ncbi:MAG: FkbM family methyltransferase [Rhodobacteraceae bacterium]|nr:FkbM family methyltransferase [Paracoccaceae bacterium]